MKKIVSILAAVAAMTMMCVTVSADELDTESYDHDYSYSEDADEPIDELASEPINEFEYDEPEPDYVRAEPVTDVPAVSNPTTGNTGCGVILSVIAVSGTVTAICGKKKEQ